MIRALVTLPLALCAAPALAQVSNPGSSDAVARLAAQQAQATADSAVIATPPVCATTPAGDTYGGTVGVASACTPRQDAARPTQVQPTSTVTLADGTFSGNWPATFSTSPTSGFAAAKTTGDPYICQVAAMTTTAYSGKCWKVTASTLPALAPALLGYVVSTFTNPAAGLPIMVVGRQ